MTAALDLFVGDVRAAATSASRAPVCIAQTSRTRGRSLRTSSSRSECSADSTTTAMAPESDRIHEICVGELVSYTGTMTAPA